MNVLKSLDSIKVQYEAVVKSIGELKAQQKALKKAGIDYGTPNYKEGRYLRIVRPATEERGREFEYIGADPEKQNAILSAIGRGKEYDSLGESVKKLEDALSNLDNDVSNLARRFEWSHGLAIDAREL